MNRFGLVCAASLLLTLAACSGDPAGTPCETVGSGFTASHDCKHRCLSRWSVTCPNGDKVVPNTCSGSFECSVGSCPDGQVCYFDDDPFDDRSFCVMANTCGDATSDELRRWELQTRAVQAEVIADRADREARKAKWQAENPDAGTISAPAQTP